MLNKIIQNRERLEYCLSILKSCRDTIVNDFLDENPEIYLPSLRYEEDQVALKLSIEKYLCVWIDDHLIKAQEKNNLLSNNQNREYFDYFCCNFIDFLDKTQIHKNKHYSFFYLDLLKKKVHFIEELLRINDKDEMRLKRILYLLEKEKKIFERKIKKLLEENYGDI